MVTLLWDTQADWDAAQSRARVVTRDVGVRNPGQIWQGYDPSHPIVNDAVAYWPLDESAPVDEIGTADGVRSGTTTGRPGILSSNAHQYDGIDDVISVDSMPLADPGSSWTANVWVRITSRLSYRLYFSLEDSVAQESLGIGNWSDGNAKIYSAGRTPGTGSPIPLNEWAMVTLRWDAGTQTASMFLNGTFDYSVQPSGGGSIFASANQLTLGNRRVGPNAPVEGRLSDVLLFDRALTDAEIQSLYDTIGSGTLTTGTQQSDYEAVEVTTAATVPTNTSATMTVHQYDGVTSHSQTVTVPDGVATHTLTNFEPLAGANYWVDIGQQSTTPEATSQIESVAVEVYDPTPVTENLDWATQADWDGAQSRTGVVTRAIGDRAADDVALGYDPSYDPANDFDCYWTFDEDTGTLVDVINGRNGSKSGATAGVEGVLGSSAVRFDGSDYVSVANAPIFNTLGEMTWAMWVKTNVNSTSGYNSLVGKGDLSGTGSFLIEFDDDLLTLYVGNYSTFDEANPVTFTDDEWHHIAVEWDKDSGVDFFVDGQPHGSGTSTAVSMPNTSSPVTIGSDLPYGTYYTGDMDEVMFSDDEDNPQGIAALYNAGSTGTLTTDTRISAGAATSLATTANIPTGTAINATVNQDTTGNGVADNSETISLTNGTNVDELAGFESVTNATYWVDIEFSTTDTTQTPTLSSASVDTAERARLFTSTVRLGGQMVDIPVYALEDVTRSCARMRNDVTGEVGAANVIEPSHAKAIIRHPTDGLLGIETTDREP